MNKSLSKPVLKIDNISFSYENRVALNQINLQLYEGEAVAFVGASGSGKSTLFKLIAGILTPLQGTISFPLQSSNHNPAAYMMQDDLLLPWRTVLDNVSLPLELGKKPLAKRSAHEIARASLAEVGLLDYAHCYPDELSGGMRQRVSLAKALIQKRPILLLDEPFGSLDVALRDHLYALLREIREKFQTTQLLVTHDFRDAVSLADRILLLANRTIQEEWIVSPAIRSDVSATLALQNEIKLKLKSSLTF